MLTICWAAKGGSGTSVTTAALSLVDEQPTIAVDLDGELPQIFGIGEPDVPGFLDWMESDADPSRLDALQIPLTGPHALIHRGSGSQTPVRRWQRAAEFWSAQQTHVIVDAGTRPPSAILETPAARRLLVTRQCYLSVRAAARSQHPIDGIVLIEEPGRSLRSDDIELALAAPVLVRLIYDPAIARAVDAGLLTTRLPRSMRRGLREVTVTS